ncbi:hypothetical protein SAMD00023353_5200940 [Rosellinia necatrix]|uniref:Uncharacterized protein n=1 Tax=Rosellinia necatrix TaxID=77044 RepID=A0A1W2TQN4_ROSNE|nr:hypothetical protein SAMD00023353_5200940 [Rosellinia necatrix]
MAPYNMPNWLRILLLILTCVSFAPQLHRLVRRRGDASGISLQYVLLNLASATELFALGFLVVADSPEPSDIFAHDPREAGDWINLANFAVVWALWLVILLVCVVYHWRHNRPAARAVVAAYTALLAISVVPVFADAIVHAGGSSEPSSDRLILIGVFVWIHVFFLTPLITLLALLAFLVQAREVLARPSGSGTGALSVAGVALQAAVFAILTATWCPGRLVFDSPDPMFVVWYQLVGFVPVNHAFFAFEQALLLVVVEWRRRRGRDRSANLAGETQPLISD